VCFKQLLQYPIENQGLTIESFHSLLLASIISAVKILIKTNPMATPRRRTLMQPDSNHGLRKQNQLILVGLEHRWALELLEQPAHYRRLLIAENRRRTVADHITLTISVIRVVIKIIFYLICSIKTKQMTINNNRL